MVFSVFLISNILLLWLINIYLSKKIFGVIFNFLFYLNFLFLPKVFQYSISDIAASNIILINILIAYLFFNIGIYCGLAMNRKANITVYRDYKCRKHIVFSIFFIMIMFCAFYFYKNPSPIFSTNPDVQRQIFGAENGVFLRLLKYVLPFLFCVILLYNYSKKVNNILFFIVCVLNLLIGHKSSAISVVLYIFFFLNFTNLVNRLNVKFFMILGAVSIVFMFVLLMNTAGKEIFSLILNRILLFDEGGIYIFSEYVPKNGVTYGKTIWNEMGGFLSKISLGMLPMSDEFMTTGQFIVLKKTGNPSIFELVNPGFAEFYLNFGTLGEIIFPFFIGIISSIFLINAKIVMSSTKKVLYYFLACSLIGSFFGGKLGSTIVGSCITVLFVYLFINFLYKFLCVCVKTNSFVGFAVGKK